jgi:hypothetical protein
MWNNKDLDQHRTVPAIGMSIISLNANDLANAIIYVSEI